MKVRLITKLDVKPPYVVKPIHFEGLRKIGDTASIAEKYFKQGTNEIFYIDIVSSLYQREILYDEIKRTAQNIFVPFTVGGGVKNINDFSKLFHSGADKVCINTYAIQNNPNIINEAAKTFGSQAVVVNIEAKRIENNWLCYTDGGKIQTKKDVLSWVDEIQDRGAGEILLQSIDTDGTQEGYDLELAANVISKSYIPVVISSGAGNLEHIKTLIVQTNPSAIAVSSILHHENSTIPDIKKYLAQNGIEVSK